ncbi:hypothetical protein N5D52_00330 [Pseudomonas sp. GD03860]|uniref:hypothetical protein n=1 Tax=Pseudomonas TaxID=286 RepID=UPI0023643EED|nr:MULTISPECIES: hypothetical protein [Pseudomonas]MDD2060998.1 hypothetical protein [Pseudomonas putida]MDH0635372.1 hypothetical protein [Pseudomonas sp. GD03860]
MKALALMLALFSASLLAAEPQLRVQAQLLPGATAVVGETVQLQLDVLTDTWFTSAPQLPDLSLPGALATPPGDQSEHLTQRLDGTPFFGIRYQYQITVQQAGDLHIPALTVTATPGNAQAPLSATTQPLTLRVQLPAGVSAGQQVLVASQVNLSQQTSPPATALKAGDSLTRTVTLDAEGAMSLMLPVIPLEDVDGLSRYLKSPQVKQLDDGRGHALGGQRIDSATYRIEKPGKYQLPALQVQWWSTQDKTLHSATLPAISFTASANPAYQPPFSVTQDLQRLGQQTRLHLSRHWLTAGLVLALLTLVALLVRSFGEQWRTALLHWQGVRKAHREASADYAWQQVAQQLGQRPAQLTALYLWWRRSRLGVRLGTASQDVLRQCYGAKASADTTPERLLPHLNDLHQAVTKRARSATAPHGLRPLNPEHDKELP